MAHLLTAEQVAGQLGLSIGALAVMRHRKQGPIYVKMGRRVRYRMEDVDRWVNAHRVSPAGERAS